MGLNVSVYKFPLGDATNGGISGGKTTALTLVNVSGPSEPGPDAPAALLVNNTPGTLKIVAAEKVGNTWVQVTKSGEAGPMMGGNLAYTSDSRFSEAAEKLLGQRFYGGIPIHDRYESAELNAMMSH